jgi:hypothetical protein
MFIFLQCAILWNWSDFCTTALDLITSFGEFLPRLPEVSLAFWFRITQQSICLFIVLYKFHSTKICFEGTLCTKWSPEVFVFRRNHLRFTVERFLKCVFCSGNCFLGPSSNRGQHHFNFRAVTDNINIQAEPSKVLVFKVWPAGNFVSAILAKRSLQDYSYGFLIITTYYSNCF